MSTDTDNYIVTDAQKNELEANFKSSIVDPALEQRRMQIIECRAPRMDATSPPELQVKARELKAQAIAGEITLDQLRLGALEIIRAERPKGPEIRSSSRDITPDTLLAAFCRTAGLQNIGKHFDEKTLEQSDHFGSFGIQELILKAAADHGYTGRQRITQGNYKEIMSYATIRASGFSTMSMSNLLSNSATKFVADGYIQYPSRARQIAAVISAENFKTWTGYRPTAAANFEEVGAGGEIPHGTLGEETIYSYRVKTFGKMLALTRQAIIDDDLGVFDTLRNTLGRGGAQKLENDFWELVGANASDFFGNTNGNIITDVLSIEGLTAAVTKFRQLTDSNGDPALATPSILAVCPELEEMANRLYTSDAVLLDTDAEVPNGNPHKGKYAPLVVPHMSNSNYTGNSTTAWYLFANDVKASAIAYLNNVQAPTVEVSDADFNTLGLQLRGYFDYATCLADPAGGIKSTGAGA